tara:strand:+ start:3479 stop:4189 length:711 start_codon:yes stop_codon:yes gene_type:complete
MINLTIGEKKCSVPNEWSEIKLRDYEKIYTIIKNGLTKDDLEEIENENETAESITAEQMERALKNVKINREIFCVLSGLDKTTINNVDQKDMFETLSLMSNFLNQSTEERFNGKYIQDGFTFKNKRYYFPKENMKQSTFGDFIETSQLDMLAKKQEGGKFAVIAEQMAILCREKDEEFDDNKIEKKKRLFQDLTMDVVWEFVFFLTKRINIWKKNIPTFLKTANEIATATQPQIGK